MADQHVVRGSFGLHDNDNLVEVTSTKDCLLYIWALNIETFAGGVQFITPPSQFRGVGATGPNDGMVMDVPPQTGLNLGSIGLQKGETIQISSPNARIVVFLTVVTDAGGKAKMTRS